MLIDFFTRIFRNRWVTTFLGALVLAVLVWFCGPLLGFGSVHPFETAFVRYLTIAAIFVLWLVTNLVRSLHAAKQEKDLAAGIAKPEPDPNETASAEEIALLSDRLKEALANLKKAGKKGSGGKRLVSLPWYMFIGPPGAGKTTALLNCGLKFPLADTAGGPQALKGVGGTRNCDWWFTDEAVLIDTAGRYTTQDSQAAVDNAAWLGFLKMLKKHRHRRPLNGVLIAISLSDLSLLTEEQRLTHARAIRRRVRELHDELGVRVPVYVLFTKADLMAGFVEFFDNMGREEREQAWGVTFPYDDGREDGMVAGFPGAFDALLERLNDRMLERVHQEPDPQRRRLIYGFPQQLASLRDVANEFLNEAFRPSRLEPRALLRGIYFTSGTQDGTPIDRLLGTMASEFGLPRQAVTAFSGAGRSYFLSRLIREVIFGEAGLVGLDPKVEKRAKLIAYGTYGAAALFLVVLMGGWVISYINNRALIANVHAASSVYTNQVTDLAKRGPNDLDLAVVLPPLDTLRGIPGGFDEREKDVPIALELGLYQGEKLGLAAADAYDRALNGLLLPRMLGRLEIQIARQMNNPDLLYPLLKVYLVLGRQGPLDKDLVMQWFSLDVANSYPSEEQAKTRESLLAHAEAMLDQPLTPLALNNDLINRAREVLNRVPLAEYSYNRIVHSKRITSLPEWTVADNAGPGSSRVFELRSGKSLATGVPGIYTWAGYHNVFLPILPTVTQDISEDSWVLGRAKRDVATTLRDTTKLRRDVLNLYLDDYARRWDAMLADIAIKPFANLQSALDELSLLSAPASPLRDLLTSVDQQTQLSRAAATDQAAAAVEAKAGKVGTKAAGFAAVEARSGLSFQQAGLVNILGEMFGNDPNGKPIDPAKRVDEHFKSLHDFMAAPGPGVPAPIDAMMKNLLAMYQNFNQVANAPNQGQALLNQLAGGGAAGGGAGGGAAGAAQQLADMAKDMPKPVAAMLTSVSKSGAQVASSGAAQELSDAWKTKVVPLCQAAFNRYPFLAGSSEDVPVDDFANLLAPGGMMDQFFDQYLKKFVDTTTKPWRWLSPDKVPLGLSPASLAEFDRADQIKKALFGTGNQVQVRFQLVPVSLDPSVAQISIDIAGTTLTYNHGPAEQARFQWPKADGTTLVRVTMTPTSGGNATIIEKDGPWALLRLLDTATVTPSGQPDKFRITFTGGGGTATFQLNANSVNNPFTLSALRSFRCPPKL
ncbi:MAG TPA: type VI secretion system membrane subunit TssM [Rhodopila sp.]|uniref:type VI secretion system membrane subunit TssM n=1 Tax=Rhodopila sp. TaxID=2480087 RepID=UPI002D00092F|nr:type VI secretion system membrane subunit TssM [Rhodopila sp.]HVY16444.1 type VI secretion system membrane subunit TssM [Rhodopila sp.]